MANEELPGQMSIFDFLPKPDKPKQPKRDPHGIVLPERKTFDYPTLWKHRRKPGDKIARVILGDCKIATITAVEGNEQFFFYRTDRYVSFSAEEGMVPVEDLIELAAAWDGDKVHPHDLQFRQTWEWIREDDNRPMWAQIGILCGMVYWKGAMTYEFMDESQNVKKDYDKRLKEIMKSLPAAAKPAKAEHPMSWLYRAGKGYASAEYAQAVYTEHHTTKRGVQKP